MSLPVELPRTSIDLISVPVTGRSIFVAAGGDLQAAINQARPGEEIVLQRGATFTGPFTLPDKAGDGWITIRTEGFHGVDGVRVTDADSANMAKILAPGLNQSAIATDAGAHNYRITGIEVTVAPGVMEMSNLIRLGDGSSAQNNPSEIPSNIIIDHAYIHGNDSLDLRRAIALNSAKTAIIDSYISDVHSNNGDSQAIAGWNGSGVYLIQNNYLEAAGENIMLGGADPQIANMIPRDITIRGNDLYKPPSWQGVWAAKNLLELKIGQRVLIEDNHLQNSWVDRQTGFAVVLKSTNQDGTAPWSQTSDVTFRNNVIENAAGGIAISAAPDGNAVAAKRIAIENNTFKIDSDINNGRIFQLTGYGGNLSDISITNNHATLSGSSGSAITFDGLPTQNLIFAGNVISNGEYGIKGGGTPMGAGTLDVYAPGGAFSGNTLIGGVSSTYGVYAALNTFTDHDPGIANSPAHNPSLDGAMTKKSYITIQDEFLTQDTGISNDFITNNGRVHLAGQVAENVVVSIFDGTKKLGDAVVNGSSWTWDANLEAGSHTLKAVAVDASGTTISASALHPIVVDMISPNLSLTMQKFLNDTGASKSDRVSSDGAMSLGGKTDASAKVSIFDNDVFLGLTTADDKGRWTFSGFLAEGVHHLSVSSVDLAGNISRVDASKVFVVDTDITESPVIESVAFAKSGSATLSGTAKAGDTVSFYDSGSLIGTRKAGADGTWSIKLPSDTHDLTATTTSAAGSVSAPTAFIIGSKSTDRLVSTFGDDGMAGGAGADSFIFDRGFANDKILDFSAGAGDGHDVIDFHRSVFSNFADVLRAAADVGDSVVITTTQGDSLTLQGVHKASLVAADFVFHI